VHDRMRPLVGGQGSFRRIVKNLHHAVNYLEISIRMNVDRDNFPHAEELLQILAAEGLASKLTVYPGQLVSVGGNPLAPSASYRGHCFTNREFALAAREFVLLAKRYGFATPSLP